MVAAGASPWRTHRPSYRDLRTPLNILTLSRLFLVVPFWHFLSLQSVTSGCIALGVLVLWAFGDWLDGHLARTRGMGNRLGIMLDPLVDRLSTVGAVVALLSYRDFPQWAGLLFVIREAAVILVGSILALGVGRGRPSNALGKANQWVVGTCAAAYVIRAPFAWILLVFALATTALATTSYALSLRGARHSTG